jgi:23S rRNA (uridine2552-2'-O)-methyltransferase
MATRRRPDTWARKAKKEGHPARSIYKLEEIDKRFRVVKRGGRVLDLGCAPGSWSRYADKAMGKGGTLVGVDLSPTTQCPGTVIEASIHDITAAQLLEALGGPAHLVLSDMAPFTTGHRVADHVCQLELATQAFELAKATLAPGGNFVVKIFDGEDANAYVLACRPHFEKCKRVKPKATRKESMEFFLVCLGFKPDAEPKS